MKRRFAATLVAAAVAGACTGAPVEPSDDADAVRVTEAEPPQPLSPAQSQPHEPDTATVLRTRPPSSWQATADRRFDSKPGLGLEIAGSDTVVIEFDEDTQAARLEAEWEARLVDTPRVPQTDEDTKGALHYIHVSPYAYLEGRLLDICRFEDAATIWGNGGVDPDKHTDASPEERAVVEWEIAVRFDCRDPATAAKQPNPNRSRARWTVLDANGHTGEFVTSPEEALDAHQRRVEQRAGPHNTIPSGYVIGFKDLTGRFGILYSDAADPIDEVQVLTDTVLVRGGTLRGLVRNWSRELWAYGSVVTADGQSWHWPLSIQPGEVAPFEIEDWDGPADPARIRFEVAAEMSNDADLTRVHRLETPSGFHSGIRSEDYHEEMPPEIVAQLGSGDSTPEDYDAWIYNIVGAEPRSHPGSANHSILRRESTPQVLAWVAWIPDGQQICGRSRGNDAVQQRLAARRRLEHL